MSSIDKYKKYKEKYLRFKNDDPSIIINEKNNLTEEEYYNKYLKYKKKYIELTGGVGRLRKKRRFIGRIPINKSESVQKAKEKSKPKAKPKSKPKENLKTIAEQKPQQERFSKDSDVGSQIINLKKKFSNIVQHEESELGIKEITISDLLNNFDINSTLPDLQNDDINFESVYVNFSKIYGKRGNNISLKFIKNPPSGTIQTFDNLWDGCCQLVIYVIKKLYFEKIKQSITKYKSDIEEKIKDIKAEIILDTTPPASEKNTLTDELATVNKDEENNNKKLQELDLKQNKTINSFLELTKKEFYISYSDFLKLLPFFICYHFKYLNLYEHHVLRAFFITDNNFNLNQNNERIYNKQLYEWYKKNQKDCATKWGDFTSEIFEFISIENDYDSYSTKEATYKFGMIDLHKFVETKLINFKSACINIYTLISKSNLSDEVKSN